MKTAIIIGIVIGMIGCGSDNQESTPADACVMASGNCGCVIEETITYPDGGTFGTETTVVVCHDR